MSINIVDLVKNYVPQDLIAKAGSSLNESEGNVSNAVTGIIPAVLGLFASKATSGEQGAAEVLDTAKGFSNSGILGNIGSLFGNADLLSKGTSLFKGLLGDKTNSVIDSIAHFAGIKPSSSGSLISMIVPLVLGLLGKHATDNNLNASGFSSFLGSQKDHILGALPSGLGSLGAALGLNSISEEVQQTVSNVQETAASTYNYADQEVRKAGGGAKWLLPLLLLAVIALALLYFLGKGCNNTATPGEGSDTTAVAPADTLTTTPQPTEAPAAKTLTEVTLPDGVKLQAYPGGIEDQLVQFIQSDTYKTAADSTLKEKWFNFDDLNFEFGTTKLTDSSKRQLDNIAAILKAFPDVKIKVGGYTDKKGDDAANLKLSDGRAKAVQAALKAAGVSAQVPEAEGYGEKLAQVDENASDEARAADRRTSVRLLKK
ncbi:OmpA family protein [Niabella drilacis]|uniref:Outer membrane protein OmpA n=1 Tax=Niabella drilacis (strain DSM 25811 / CCM 8410 / CCUG 62505 / LMG 26954 / E90) TaxID=1285928 RepID=A0A1G6XVT3_NIADE|nr:OmpA family protein [Niabella drilacis]SDD81537.1 Outer membrane protein OmpA [Niabella drilacis]